jgi:hypothetical protein
MKKRNISIAVIILLFLILPLISAGLFQDTWNKITGKASSTQNVSLNITVTNSPPWIYAITGLSAVTLTDAPSPTFVVINFSVNDSDGAANLNNATAAINLTRGGEALRYNSSCVVKDYSGNYSNYTCNITMWWFDGAGPWNVYANITDLNGNLVVNGTSAITLNTLTGFVMSPPTLNFTNLVAGSYNNTPTNHLLLNNTGNVDISTGNIQVNASDLVGESTANRFLYAGNFSMSTFTGNNIECNITASATQMANRTFTGIVSSVLAAGNYTINDGTAQEHIYACLRQVGSELTQQQYSTSRWGPWTVQII